MTEKRSEDYDWPTDAADVSTPQPPGEVDLLPNEARAGVTHHNVRTVLTVGIVGTVALMVVAYLAFFA